MGIIVGPVVRCVDGYRFDTWTANKGVTRGYSYRRIEDAYYAWKSEIRTFAQDGSRAAVACQTLDEFIARKAAYETCRAA